MHNVVLEIVVVVAAEVAPDQIVAVADADVVAAVLALVALMQLVATAAVA